MQIHYVYKVTEILKCISYFGTRTTKEGFQPEEDIGILYFTSSSVKSFKDNFKKYPDLFKIEIIGVFDTRKEAIQKEIELHETYNVGVSPMFYNRAKQTSVGFDFDCTGRKHTPEAKRRIGQSKVGIHRSEETIKKMVESHTYYSGEDNVRYGCTHTPEARKKISQARLGTIASNETRAKMSVSHSGSNNAMYGKQHSADSRRNMSGPRESMVGEKNPFYGKRHSEETKEKIRQARIGSKASDETKLKLREAAKLKPKKECQYCHRIFDPGNYAQHHGDKCNKKIKAQEVPS